MSAPLGPGDRLTQQERANFLEEFIREVTHELDALYDGHDFDKEIKMLRFRIGLLQAQTGVDHSERLLALHDQLKRMEIRYAEVRPQIEALEAERRYYRAQTSGF